MRYPALGQTPQTDPRSAQISDWRTGIRSSGWYKGTSCPGGMVVLDSREKARVTNMGLKYDQEVQCGAPPVAPAGPESVSTTNIEVSPAIQSAVTPTVSPTFAQMQDSPYAAQSGQTSAQVPTGFSADRPKGMSAEEVRALLADQQEAEREDREAYESRQQELLSQERELMRQEAEARERMMALQQQQREAELQAQLRREKYLQEQAAAATTQQATQTAVSDQQMPAPVEEKTIEETPAETGEKTGNGALLLILGVTGATLYAINRNKTKRKAKR